LSRFARESEWLLGERLTHNHHSFALGKSALRHPTAGVRGQQGFPHLHPQHTPSAGSVSFRRYRAARPLTAVEAVILKTIAAGEASLDAIAADSGLETAEVLRVPRQFETERVVAIKVRS